MNGRMLRIIVVSSAILAFAAGFAAAERHRMTPEDLWKLKRLGSLALSPDGTLAAVVVTGYDLEENKGQGDIWLVAMDGKPAKHFTRGKTSESSPVWSPDGKKIAFTAKRDGDDAAQLYVMPIDGGEAVRVTEMPVDVEAIKWAPTGGKILFVSEIIPGYEEKLGSMKEELERRKNDKVTAKKTVDRFYRYWDHWRIDGRVPHLFAVNLKDKKVVDLTPGWNRFFNDGGGLDYDISPDGAEIAFTALRYGSPYDSLISDIYLLPADGSGEARNITRENSADDFSPRYTPDGKYILYGMQKIAGFYGDRVRLVRFDRASEEKKVLTESWDRSPFEWKCRKFSGTVEFLAEDRGRVSIFSIGLDGGAVQEIYRGGTCSELALQPSGGFVFLQQTLSSPNEVYILPKGTPKPRRLTTFNDEILASIAFGRVEETTYKGFDGVDIQMFIVYPPGFNASLKWPLLLLIHGGPHGVFGDDFHYRWNAQTFAAPGYVTAMINFHGSSSFGQDFTDAISGEHGRKPFEDVMKAVDYLIGRGFIDEKRMAVAGGSYGGYLVSWIGTQTDRFACIINHAGVFDLYTQYGSDITDGRERAYGGTPWTNPDNVLRWSPAHHMEKYVTPTLVVHGEKDYRVPVGNALELYGMLKAKGVQAKLVYFPNENHWVLSPKNSIFWYGEFGSWLRTWIGVGPK